MPIPYSCYFWGWGPAYRRCNYSAQKPVYWAVFGYYSGSDFLFQPVYHRFVNYDDRYLLSSGWAVRAGQIGRRHWVVFKNDTIFVFLVVLPSAIIASILGAPAWVVFACLKCDQILKCFVAVVKINRFDWMKNLTRDKRLDQPV